MCSGTVQAGAELPHLGVHVVAERLLHQRRAGQHGLHVGHWEVLAREQHDGVLLVLSKAALARWCEPRACPACPACTCRLGPSWPSPRAGAVSRVRQQGARSATTVALPSGRRAPLCALVIGAQWSGAETAHRPRTATLFAVALSDNTRDTRNPSRLASLPCAAIAVAASKPAAYTALLKSASQRLRRLCRERYALAPHRTHRTSPHTHITPHTHNSAR